MKKLAAQALAFQYQLQIENAQAVLNNNHAALNMVDQALHEIINANEKLKDNTLDSQFVKSLPPEIRPKYEKALILQGDVKFHNDAKKSITRRVKQIAKIAGTGTDEQTLAMGTKAYWINQDLQTRYNQEFQKAVAAGQSPGLAIKTALDATNKYLDDNSKPPEVKEVGTGRTVTTIDKTRGGDFYFDGKGFKNYSRETIVHPDTKAIRSKELKESVTSSGGKEILLNTPEGVYTIEELKTITSNYKTYGGYIPDNVIRDADELGVKPLELINRQIRALGIDTETEKPYLPVLTPILSGEEAIHSILFP